MKSSPASDDDDGQMHRPEPASILVLCGSDKKEKSGRTEARPRRKLVFRTGRGGDRSDLIRLRRSAHRGLLLGTTGALHNFLVPRMPLATWAI